MEHITEEQLLVRGCRITVKLQQQVIHISNDRALRKLLNGDTEGATEELIVHVKNAYQQLFGEALQITDASLAVEIWGHVYVEYLVKVAEQKLDWSILSKLADKVTENCEMIDCGESSADSNRFFWDMMAPFKKAIASLLPQHIDEARAGLD